MDNTTPSQETKPAEVSSLSPSPVVPVESPIDKAEKLIKGIDEATRRFEDVVKRNEDTLGRIMLSGRGSLSAAQPTPEQARADYIKAEVEKTMNKWGYGKRK